MISNALVLARRFLARTLSRPQTLIGIALTPVALTLLFAAVLGDTVSLPGGIDYHDYLVPGMFAMTVASAATGTAVAVNSDMTNGIIDRFRSLPMSGAGVLVGQSLAALLTTAVAAALLAVTGTAIGWRVHAGAPHVAAAFGLILLFAYALNWGMSCLGMLFRSAEGLQQFGLLLTFGSTLLSSAFVPTANMPSALKTVAHWNPLNVLTVAVRNQLGAPHPADAAPAWPMQHPEAATMICSLAMLAVFAPLAVRLYRTRRH
ncbi:MULTISPECIES: ABC transporter permease [unclassified Streptomyces]|uniref:ABC transporter permease n=1 Tax=unclassified Streptomyces TaxID=2593676 RepID=UPI002E2D0231|nr:ABC transporter permease [Streptomyces sp. NBC_00273]